MLTLPVTRVQWNTWDSWVKKLSHVVQMGTFDSGITLKSTMASQMNNSTCLWNPKSKFTLSLLLENLLTWTGSKLVKNFGLYKMPSEPFTNSTSNKIKDKSSTNLTPEGLPMWPFHPWPTVASPLETMEKSDSSTTATKECSTQGNLPLLPNLPALSGSPSQKKMQAEWL